MLFAQMSEEPAIKLVYDDLFQEDGSEIYVKPVEPYFDSLPAKASFADLMRLAQKRDEEACIGVKIGAFSNEPKKITVSILSHGKTPSLSLSLETH